MLAAESTWAVLRAEHNRLRALLDQVDQLLQLPGVVAGARAQILADAVQHLQSFDEAIHRPKGALLLSLLEGRSLETDELLERLGATRRHCDRLLTEVHARLNAAANGVPGAAEQLPKLLAEHRALMFDHLQAEDTLLHSQSAMLLTRDEWAAIASSVSNAIPRMKS